MVAYESQMVVEGQGVFHLTPFSHRLYRLRPDSRKVSSLTSEILVSNLRFFSDLRPFAQLGFAKDLRLRFFSDLVSNLRQPRG